MYLTLEPKHIWTLGWEKSKMSMILNFWQRPQIMQFRILHIFYSQVYFSLFIFRGL